MRNVELKDLAIGDVIWGKRYKTKKEMLAIKENHQEGPFIVVKKTKCRIYALICTSKKYNGISSKVINLDKINDYYDKRTYAIYDRVVIINKHNYIYKVDEIGIKRLENIYKMMYAYLKQHRIKNISKQDIYCNLTYGDIINYKNTYYYINSVDKQITAYKLVNKKKNDYFRIMDNYYYFASLEEYTLPKKGHFRLVTPTNEVEQKIIATKINRFNIKTGSLISYNNKLYYILEYYSDYMELLEVFASPFKEGRKILINHKKYYTTLKKVTIKSKSNYIKLDQATSAEKRIIKRIPLNVQYKNKVRIKTKTYAKYVEKKVVRNTNDYNYYLIINRNEEDITLLLLNNYKETISYKLNERTKEEYELVGLMSDIEYKLALFKYNTLN